MGDVWSISNNLSKKSFDGKRRACIQSTNAGNYKYFSTKFVLKKITTLVYTILTLITTFFKLEKNIQAFGSIRSSISQSSSGTLLGADSNLIGGDDFAKLIIMDRGMDLKTPLMHDLTFLVSLFRKTAIFNEFIN